MRFGMGLSLRGVECRMQHYQCSFWDMLSRIWLSRDALKEFDRRNNQTTHRPWFLSEHDLQKSSNLLDTGRLISGASSLSERRGCASEPTDLLFQFSSLRVSVDDSMSKCSSSTRKWSSISEQNGTTTNYDIYFKQKLINQGFYPNNRASKP